MTGFEYIYIINIFSIICFTAYLSYIVGKMKHSLYFCIARWLFHSDTQYLKWLKSNLYYLPLHFIIPGLLIICLSLISQLNIGIPQVRPAYAVIAWIVIWWGMTMYVHILNNKIQRNESSN